MVRGIVTALITPFTEDGDLCTECLEDMIRFQIEKGIAGLYISGTYGEGVITSSPIREKLLIKAIEFSPSRVFLLPHVGGSDTDTIIRLAKLAKDLGYLAVSVVGPLYHIPTKKGLVEFYKYIASKTDIPIVIYNHRERQRYNISPDDYEAIAREVPEVIGIKDTSYDVEQLLEYVKRFSAKHFIAGGGDNLLYYTFSIGAHAHICGTSNVFPEIAVALYKAVSEYNYMKAVEYQYKVNLVRKILGKYGVEVQEVIRVMLKLRGIKSGYPPKQLIYEFTPQQIEELVKLIECFAIA
ncbi:MAG: dihydrodipicolinate synthase family protein [Ignisphaera sp.]|uniref:Dihydrodipicolinate synthase family protein n=1 Tax=Ignisphaera aggregans TaxID=334771 RepID=A0A7C4JK10_9CREN